MKVQLHLSTIKLISLSICLGGLLLCTSCSAPSKEEYNPLKYDKEECQELIKLDIIYNQFLKENEEADLFAECYVRHILPTLTIDPAEALTWENTDGEFSKRTLARIYREVLSSIPRVCQSEYPTQGETEFMNSIRDFSTDFQQWYLWERLWLLTNLYDQSSSLIQNAYNYMSLPQKPDLNILAFEESMLELKLEGCQNLYSTIFRITDCEFLQELSESIQVWEISYDCYPGQSGTTRIAVLYSDGKRDALALY